MKMTIGSVCAVLVAASTILAEDAPKTQKGSPEFERMKTLVGTWQGKVDIGQGPVDMVAKYRLLAGGSILEERVFENTPNEMVTMIYEKNGKLALTHYCMMGNRPGMVLKSSDANTIRFSFDESCGIDPKKEAHMSGLTLTFNDANTLTASCKAVMDGKEMPENPTVLKRVEAVVAKN